jgi:ankyrin repeat protein
MISQTRQLHHAAHSGDVEALKYLLESGIDPDIRSNDGWTAFHRAAVAGKTDCAALLLDAGADIEAIVTEEDIHGTTGLALAIMNGRVDTVDLLIRRGADVNREARGRLNALGVARDVEGRPWHKIAEQVEAIIRLLKEAGASE